MKKNKKLKIATLIICPLIISLLILVNKNPYTNEITYNKNTSFSASYIIPEELKELEGKSELIVKGNFTGERIEDKDKNVIGPSSVSQFEINQIYKGNKSEKNISVLEPFKIENQDFVNIEGYIPMRENEEYILFLRENDTPNGKQYTIISINYGKYNISDNNPITPIKNKTKYLKDVSDQEFITPSKEECDIYNNLKKDIINKYN